MVVKNQQILIDFREKKNIVVRMPRFFAEAGITKLSHYNFKILNILLAALSRENVSPQIRTFILQPEVIYEVYKEDAIQDNALYKKLKRNIPELLEFQYTEDFDKWHFVFESIKVKNASIYATFNQEFIDYYVSEIATEKHPSFYNVTLASKLKPYELKLYLMCRNFVTTEKRMTDDRVSLMHRVGYYLPPERFSTFKQRILDPSVESISKNTDIRIKYSTRKYKGISKINFSIKPNKRKFVETKADEWNQI